MINYFTLLHLPSEYDLDEQLLENNMLQLQQQTHPDRMVGKDSAEQQQASHQTATINLAYQVLKDPMRRAAHLLELAGHDLENVQVELEPLFLQEAMQWRFALEEMEDVAAINHLLSQLMAREQRSLHILGEILRKKLPNEAIQLYTELKFLQRFKQEVIAKLDSYDEVI